jgi:mono/diheme cytochrome c family protein
MKMGSRLIRGGCFLLALSWAHAQERLSTSKGMFSEAQAKRGAAAYNSNCASCHGDDLRSTDREVSNLDEETFKRRFVGKTIGDLFETAKETMPPELKGSLDDQTYLDIVTYILKFNKTPSGSQELKPDLPLLKRIFIDPL